jgi:diguanylate cyclase (GGDEF)-like protein/PAS domain S-box-containing protein
MEFIMLKNISAKNRVLLFVSAILVLFSLFIFLVFYFNQKSRVLALEESYYSGTKELYEKILQRHKSFYEHRIAANIDSKGVKEAFATKNRELLYELTKGRWEALKKENKYLRVMHFHLANGESFLRMHKPDKYGDNIGSLRPMVAKMHKDKKPLYGFEAGIFNLAYRVFLPIFYKDSYIGAVELGSRPDQLLDEMEYFNNIKGALFIKSDKLNLYRESESFELNNYTLQYSTMKDSVVKKLPSSYDFEDKIEFLVDDREYSVYSFSLKSFNGEETARLILFHDITTLKRDFIKTFINLFLILIFLLVLVLIIINLGFRKIIDKLDISNKELESSKQFSDSIMNNSPYAIITTNIDGIITLFNKKAQDMLGYDSSELVDRKSPMIFYRKSELDVKAKEFQRSFNLDIKSDFDIFTAKTKINLTNSDEWTYFRKNGKRIQVSTYITALKDLEGNTTGYMAMVEDITDIKNKDRVISSYMDLVDKNVITSSTDLKGIITYASEAFCNMSGYTQDELLGQNHSIIKHPDMAKDIYRDLWKTISSNRVWSGEIKNLTKDGGFYWVYATISPVFDFNGNKIGYTSVRQDITDKKKIEKLSITDELTGIYNRREFNRVFPEFLNRLNRSDNFVAFLMIDVDYFKQYNDTYGHQNGDEVLKNVASIIKKLLKRSDDYLFRLGGEEFGILLETNSCDNALTFANMIRDSILEAKIQHSSSTISDYLTVSIGVTCKSNSEAKSTLDIYKEADEMLYKAKENGRNRVYMNS